jgi:hypothetical protein
MKTPSEEVTDMIFLSKWSSQTSVPGPNSVYSIV